MTREKLIKEINKILSSNKDNYQTDRVIDLVDEYIEDNSKYKLNRERADEIERYLEEDINVSFEVGRTLGYMQKKLFQTS